MEKINAHGLCSFFLLSMNVMQKVAWAMDFLCLFVTKLKGLARITDVAGGQSGKDGVKGTM